MMKRYVRMLCFVLLSIVAVVPVRCATYAVTKDARRLEYRTEAKPIKDRFPDMPDFSSCYWKTDTIGRPYLGPTNYWIKGFICLEEQAFQEVLVNYEWSVDSIVFPKGIDPSITGESEFDWYASKDFETMVLQQRFAGTIHLDILNGVLYLAVWNI